MTSPLPDLEPWRWRHAALAALLSGFATTGVPGAGSLFVPLMVSVSRARLSLPLLLGAGVLWGLGRVPAGVAAVRLLFPE